MFNSASVYEGSFDEWKPYGIPGAVQSDAGFNGFVKSPIEAHNQEFRLAGSAIENFMAASNAHRNKETAEEVSEMYKSQGKSSGGSSGIGGSVGSTLGGIAGNIIAPGIGGGIGSALGGALGGLFG